jgi:hypothetical protein
LEDGAINIDDVFGVVCIQTVHPNMGSHFLIAFFFIIPIVIGFVFVSLEGNVLCIA